SCSAKAPKECADFLNYLTTKDVQIAMYMAFNSLPVSKEAQSVITEPYLKAVLDAYNKAPYVSQWLDTVYGQNVRNALNVAVVIFPVVMAAYYGFYKWKGYGVPTNFVGLQNYKTILQDSTFHDALLHNGLIVVLSLILQGPIALIFALMLNQKIRGRSTIRLL